MKLAVQGQGDGKILDVAGQARREGGRVVLENWIIFMDVICVSSLKYDEIKDLRISIDLQASKHGVITPV